jgi:acyl-CoA thioesterase-1
MRSIIKIGGLIVVSMIMTSHSIQKKEIGFLPLGDSYTICTGAKESESWPTILTKHVNEAGIALKLLDNPARNGFTTQKVIDFELPLLKKLKPEVVTLLIGVNDWVQERPKNEFEKNYLTIIDEVQNNLSDKGKLILITIPDFGVTETGKTYSGGRDISKGIAEFNTFIIQTAKARKLELVDIFELSKKMGVDRSLVANDGLHPSAKEYAEWEKLILPTMIKVMK